MTPQYRSWMPPKIVSCMAGLLAVLIALFSPAAFAADPANVTVQLPTFGVAVDAEGLLEVKQAVDPDGRLSAARLAAARAELPANIQAANKLRKVSLVRLDRAVRDLVAQGQPPDAAMRHLAGLERISAVFCYPEAHDIVIAGPAAGWCDDGLGRAISIRTGRPVLLLEDLAVALRAYSPERKPGLFVGCTIDPPAEGLARLQQFQRTVPHSVPDADRKRVALEVMAGMAESLGLADVRVFGISPRTHLAAVLVEADYRMKRIGIGLERPPVAITSFLDALGGSRVGTLQRWWFTPDYRCVNMTDDRLAMELVGEAVKLQGEDKVIGPQGNLLAGGPPNRASERFTASFTRRYPELAARSPVFAQLRQSIDLLVACAFLRKHDYYAQADWHPAALLDEAQLPTEVLPPAQKVACVANAQWKGGRLQAPAGGGVSIVAEDALTPERVRVVDGKQLTERRAAAAPPEGARWWWD